MHPGFRAAFNAAFTNELVSSYAEDLVRRAGREPGFRLAETPVFLTDELTATLEDGARAIVAPLARPEALGGIKQSVAPSGRFAAQLVAKRRATAEIKSPLHRARKEVMDRPAWRTYFEG